MHDTSILKLGQVHADPSGRSISVRRYLWASLVAAAGLLVWFGAPSIVAALRGTSLFAPAGQPVVRFALDDLREVSSLNVDDKAQIMVVGITAQKENAEIPLSGLPLEHTRSFHLAENGQDAYRSALKCLSQAVYYEAAVEPLEGRRAVAQVVLNRMRHPAYPKSVCGVVYQGSERRTGCQFSFTCDGSLMRVPVAHAWQEAVAVAREALAGHVEADVGTATHYHADYVLPKWAFELSKITKFGRHIFYRFNGSWGRAAAFSGRYSGIEHIPAINFLALRERLASDGELPAETFSENLTVPPHVTDRHATADVGGRIDMTKAWRLNIPDPVAASTRYREAIASASASQNEINKTAHAEQLVVDLQQ